MRKLLEYFSTIIFALIIVYLINVFLFMSLTVQQDSMKPSFVNGDRVLIQKRTITEMQRSDVVLIVDPETKGDAREHYLIKRVYGVPGDHVQIVHGDLFINGKEVLNGRFDIDTEVDEKLSKKEYYLLGDNLKASKDSRTFGPVKESDCVGKIILRFYPFPRFAII